MAPNFSRAKNWKIVVFSRSQSRKTLLNWRIRVIRSLVFDAKRNAKNLQRRIGAHFLFGRCFAEWQTKSLRIVSLMLILHFNWENIFRFGKYWTLATFSGARAAWGVDEKLKPGNRTSSQSVSLCWIRLQITNLVRDPIEYKFAWQKNTFLGASKMLTKTPTMFCWIRTSLQMYAFHTLPSNWIYSFGSEQRL